MNMGSLTSAIITVAEVAAGAVLAEVVKARKPEIFGLPTDAVLAGTLLLAGASGYGGKLAFALAAGAAVVPLKDKLAPLVHNALPPGGAVAGYPYQIGATSRGTAMYALPQGATGEAGIANLQGAAGLV